MKKFLSFTLAFLICFGTSGCYDSKEISRIAFVLAVGFDTSSYSFQLVKPSAFEGEGSEDSPLYTVTVEAPNVYIAMNKLNSQISESCDYSHIKIVIFSKEKLKNGIKPEITAMLKSNDFHPNTRVAACDGKASDYMKNIEIPLNANPAEFYENIFKQNFTVYSPDVTLKDMQQAYKTHIHATVLPTITNSRTVVIKDYKLTDTLEDKEIIIYNLLTEKSFNVNYPIEKDAVVNIKKHKKSCNVSIASGIPVITVKLKVEGDVVWSEGNTDIKKTEEKLKWLLQNQITDLMKKCSSRYKADIFEIYKLARTNYLTVESWEKEDWQGLFEKAEYKVIIDADIKREGLIKE